MFTDILNSFSLERFSGHDRQGNFQGLLFLKKLCPKIDSFRLFSAALPSSEGRAKRPGSSEKDDDAKSVSSVKSSTNSTSNTAARRTPAQVKAEAAARKATVQTKNFASFISTLALLMSLMAIENKTSAMKGQFLIITGLTVEVDSAASPYQVAFVGQSETGEISQPRIFVFVFSIVVQQSKGTVAAKNSDEGEEPLRLGRGQRRRGSGELDGKEDHHVGGGGQGAHGREAARDEGACACDR